MPRWQIREQLKKFKDFEEQVGHVAARLSLTATAAVQHAPPERSPSSHSPLLRPRPPRPSGPRQVQAAAREMLEEGGIPKGRSDKAKLKKDKTLAPVRV